MDIQINPCRDGWLQVSEQVAVADPPGSALTVYVDPERQQVVHYFTVPGEPDRAVFMDPAEQRDLRSRIWSLMARRKRDSGKVAPMGPGLLPKRKRE